MSDERMRMSEKDIQHLKEENDRLRSEINIWEEYFRLHKEALMITDGEFTIQKLNDSALSLFQKMNGDNIPANLSDFFSGERDFPSYLMPEANPIDEPSRKRLSMDGRKDHHRLDSFCVTEPQSKRRIVMLQEITREHDQDSFDTINSNLLGDISDHLLESILVYTGEGFIVDCNRAFTNISGIKKSALIGKHLSSFIHPDDWQRFQSEVKQVGTASSLTGKLRLIFNQENIPVQYINRSNFYSGFSYTIFNEYRKQELLERKLLECDEMFSSLFEQALDSILLIDNEGKIIQVNGNACKIFERPAEELINSEFCDLSDQNCDELKRLLETIRDGGELKRELVIMLPNKEKKTLECTWNRLKNNQYTLIVFKNISERKEMERELRLSEHKFKKIFDGSFDGILIWENSGKVVDINHAGAEIIGLPKNKILDCVLPEIFELTEYQHKNWKRHTILMSKNHHHHFVCELKCRDGKQKQLDFSSRPKVIDGMNMTVFRDITDKVRMEEQLKKSDTLNVVGELAAGIAHEIRNPMTALKGFIQLLEGSLQGDYSTYFHVISSELQRIETIITDFLILAKPQAVSYQVKQVNDIINNTLDLLSAQASMLNIQFQTDYGQLPLVHCEGNQLKQVFINLIKNAIEAMPGGGLISIKTEPFFDNHILISIKDCGIGIPETVLKKIGEPFYTTKEKGTGLGLMVTYKIIEEHQGWIEVSSEEGKGTLFQIYLPIHHEA